MIKISWVQPKLERYDKIKCFTCDQFLPGKAALKRHMGHSVHYTDKDGRIQD